MIRSAGLLFLASLALPGCAPKTPAEKASLDKTEQHVRYLHLRNARILDGSGKGPAQVPSPVEIRRGPPTPAPFGLEDEVYCDFLLRKNKGGNPKFRCFLMSGRKDQGGHYYDEFGELQPKAVGIERMDVGGEEWDVLVERNRAGELVPLTRRYGFFREPLTPFELKIKYRYPDHPNHGKKRDMYSEVAATRLLWALGYPTDHWYRVKAVYCHRCPPDPFDAKAPASDGHYEAFNEAAIEIKYRSEEVEQSDSVAGGGWGWTEAHHLRYGAGREGFGHRRKSHFDGLVVLMNLLRNDSTMAKQNRLVCVENRIQRVGEYFQYCPDTVMLVHDLGSVFGKSSPPSFESWRNAPVWRDPASCTASLPPSNPDEHSGLLRPRSRYNQDSDWDFVVGEDGQQFILNLLDQLSDEHLRAIFESARFENFDPFQAGMKQGESGMIDQWIEAFKAKVEMVRQGQCAGA